MKIVHLLHEFPDPPTSGIRCDMGRRLDAFLALGHSVFGIAWASEGAGEIPSPERLAALKERLAGFCLLTIGADLKTRARRVWNLHRHPSYIAARIPTEHEIETLISELRRFSPDLIWLEGVHPSWLAIELKRRLGVPLAYRSHNIEHLYLAEQASLASTARQKLALNAGTWGLERAERNLYATADRVFDISADDLAFWQKQGMTNSAWLAPQPDPTILATMGASSSIRDIDLMFVGSLSSPNNIAGIGWYIDAIHPEILASLGDVRVVIAGRRPPDELAARVEAAGIELIPNPAHVAPLFERALVTMNPILHGSGVNIKTIDMFASGQPVVTTTKGARGLPAEVVAELDIADNPKDFAMQAVQRIIAARKGTASADRHLLIDKVFGHRAVAAALSQMSLLGVAA